MSTVFVQDAPRRPNTYAHDWLLRSWLQRKLGPAPLAAIEPELLQLGELAAGRLSDLQAADRRNEPVLTQWDPWGTRIDHIEVTALWREAEALAVRFGLTAVGYERREGPWSRTRQFALAYLFHPVSDFYTCPLAMTDGAARALLDSGNARLIQHAVPHLTSRDPAQFWTSGQWMTESTGGSDVGLTRTAARQDASGSWRLQGKKWFTSAASSQMALTLARPDGNGPGGSGLAMFYLETHDAGGRLNGIRIERLKEKLGTRKVPTAELTLENARAELVAGTTHGTHAIEPMLKITRCWNSICASAFMRHGVALARDYARRRLAFGSALADQPLHHDTLLGLEAETAGAFVLTFFLIELLGHEEAGQADDEQAVLLRLLTPIAKLVTGRQAVHVTSEAIEAFGGAGYIEDTGLPVLLRDAQVLPIWEGTTNVLSLDVLLRTDLDRGLAALLHRVRAIANALGAGANAGAGASASANANANADADGDEFRQSVAAALAAIEHATRWRVAASQRAQLQAGARRFAMTLGRALELALLAEHGDTLTDAHEAAVCRALCGRLRLHGVDRVWD